MIIWNDQALARGGMTTDQADALLELSAEEFVRSAELEYEEDVARLRARRAQRDATTPPPAPPPVHAPRRQPAPPRVFPAGVHIERYSKLASQLGY